MSNDNAPKQSADPHESMRRTALAAFGSPRWQFPLNCALQLLCVRLEAELEWSGPQFSVGGTWRSESRDGVTAVVDFKTTHVSLDGPGRYSISGWDLLYGVVPFTGWRCAYWFLFGGPRRVRLWKVRRSA